VEPIIAIAQLFTNVQSIDFSAPQRILKWRGHEIGIELFPGDTRWAGTDREKMMKSGYGHIRRHIDHTGDKEALDVYLPQDFLNSPDEPNWDIFELDQMRPDTGKFDEHKMVIARSIGEACTIYGNEMPEAFMGQCRHAGMGGLAKYRKQFKDLTSDELAQVAGVNMAESTELSDEEWDKLSEVTAADWLKVAKGIAAS
jgi:hypothetical protein